MESSGMLYGLMCISLLTVICTGQVSQEISSENVASQNSEMSTERELIEAMEALLGKYPERPHAEEKRGIPTCLTGSRCAVRLGPRIGKLCECGRGSNCNSFLLKCI
ncbi:cocaine- and amphetamine-regulated transcript-like [Chanos chanos]|uniref:Cocaine- and amphetamine-regulated transcript-like n=1 Tax=Chanos chanos TaxID=29144 RepID=A0A6J2WVD4_CHACN|nr:cocaine- and amphetamine-regulated transcript protein-like [Chanos chanos]